MSAGLLYALTGAFLFMLGAAGAARPGPVLRRILAFNIMGSGAFLVLVGLAQRHGGVDPAPQAMVLTGIVVAVASTALALALGRRIAEAEEKDAADKLVANERATEKHGGEAS